MKVFEGTPRGVWVEKVNFVDDNNVFVGYDMGQSCCEHADWFIATEITKEISSEKDHPRPDLDGYIFDVDFMEKVDSIGDDYNELDEGGMVIFKMTKSGQPDLYLHLFNCHNGYYGHGFEMKIGEDVKHDEWI